MILCSFTIQPPFLPFYLAQNQRGKTGFGRFLALSWWFGWTTARRTGDGLADAFYPAARGNGTCEERQPYS
jgi:hypothetical protein